MEFLNEASNKRIRVRDPFNLVQTIEYIIVTNPNKREALEELEYRKINNDYLIRQFMYKYPGKQPTYGLDEKLDALLRERDVIQSTINGIKSNGYTLDKMKPFREKDRYLDPLFNEYATILNSKNYKYLFENPQVIEIISSISPDDITNKIGDTPDKILTWMSQNISYEEWNNNWKLKTVQETYHYKKGNCHDQSYFEYNILKSLGYTTGQIFFIEYKEDSDVGGATHTLTWYMGDPDDHNKLGNSIYWIENAWQDYAGIHGPFKSFTDLEVSIRSAWKNDNDGNYDDIKIFNSHKFLPGSTLDEYVKGWVMYESMDLKEFNYKNNSDNINESSEIIESNFNDIYQYLLEEANIDLNIHFDERGYIGEDYIESDNIDELSNWIEAFTYNENTIFNVYTMGNLPDIMYHGSPYKYSTIQSEKVFLTPYKGLASIFIIDIMKIISDEFIKKTGRNPKNISINTGYQEWEDLNGSELSEPLKKVHIKHNIPEFTDVIKGSSTGYIYSIDISNIRDQLKLFSSNNPDREVYYDGGDALTPLEVIEYTINWELQYDPKQKEYYGKGIVESINNDDILSEFLYEAEENNEEDNNDPPELTSEDKEENDILNQNADDKVQEEESDETTDDEVPEEEIQQEEPEEDTSAEETVEDEQPKEEAPPKKETSLPKQTDANELDKNGVRRKKLYIAFIEWCKEYNNKNTFGSVFDKDAFTSTYPFVPEEMRYFYRLANPLLCVLGGHMTFFALTELRKVNKDNPKMNEQLIFAATDNDMRVFNTKDKKVYFAVEENKQLVLKQVLGETFDLYIQNMIKRGDILNGPIEDPE